MSTDKTRQSKKLSGVQQLHKDVMEQVVVQNTIEDSHDASPASGESPLIGNSLNKGDVSPASS